jgi:hypothetical protein
MDFKNALMNVFETSGFEGRITRINLAGKKWELCYEGHHYSDCQRTGHLLEEFALNTNAYRKADATVRHYIYPIPFNAMEANPSLNQNAGW